MALSSNRQNAIAFRWEKTSFINWLSNNSILLPYTLFLVGKRQAFSKIFG